MALFYEFICDESQLPVKVTSSPTLRLLPRPTHDKILAEHRSGTSLSFSPLSFDSFPLEHFTTIAKYPASLFRDGKIAVTLDIMVHALHAIWTYSSEASLDFRLLVNHGCSHIPSYFISRFRHAMQISAVIATPIVPTLSSRVYVGVSTFGASVMGESYLRVMVPKLTDTEPSDTSERSDTVPFRPHVRITRNVRSKT
ncbi:hypothetical protein BDZ89DRAFT_1145006 [Hymenopellis radicata]|nr:hypothetical protein BDZ89DRAFT_1145006 [Hymenopellis radicata]